MPDVRVSSAKTKSASFKIRIARNVMSSKFPIGVGTTYSFPIFILLRHLAHQGTTGATKVLMQNVNAANVEINNGKIYLPMH